jgi:hypothetical protein
MIKFLFIGNVGRFPKWLIYLLLGWFIFALKEWNSEADVISLNSWYYGIGGTLLAGFSLYLTSETPLK